MPQYGKVVLDATKTFATIYLQDGSGFQVRQESLVPAASPNKGYDLKPDARIYAVFLPPKAKQEETIVFLPEDFVPEVTKDAA